MNDYFPVVVVSLLCCFFFYNESSFKCPYYTALCGWCLLVHHACLLLNTSALKQLSVIHNYVPLRPLPVSRESPQLYSQSQRGHTTPPVFEKLGLAAGLAAGIPANKFLSGGG